MPKLPNLYQNCQTWGFGIYTSIFAKTDMLLFKKFKYICQNWLEIHKLVKKISQDWHYLFSMCLYELWGCVSSYNGLGQMICHKIHICNLYIHHELYGGVSPIYLNQWKIYHKSHICSLYGLHELCRCVSSNMMLW